jgi:hypothetical protein
MSPVKYLKRANGESYPVRYEVNAYCDFEDITGKNLVRLIENPELFDFRSIRAMVFVGIVYGHEYAKKQCQITLKDVGRWEDAMDAFVQCMGILKEQSPQNEGKPESQGE